jgi:uncharacterized protein YfaS (alpha-2-macroglobulin family)
LTITLASLCGDTVRFKNTIKDFDQTTLIDPDSHSIKVFDPAETLKDTITNPERDSVGVYHFYYTIPEDGVQGTWRIDWTATHATRPSKKRFEFEVAK